MQGADNARRDGALQARWAANGDHELASAQAVGVAQPRGGKLFAIGRRDAQHGDIRLRVVADDLAGSIAPVGQRHLNTLGAVHHMAIGEDVAVGGEDDARASALGDARSRPER